jgi:hypothetical protein
LKPYRFLGVELYDGSNAQFSDLMGWYYVTLAVDGKIIAHVDSWTAKAISHDVVSEHINNDEDFVVAGHLRNKDADFVFDNTGFSSHKNKYQIELPINVRERAERSSHN